MLNLDAEIEAILYYKNEPVSIKGLASVTGKTEFEIREAIDKLKERFVGGGMVIMSEGNEVSLGTAPEVSALIEKIVKDDLSKELGKATLDTLTIILYYGPISKAQIDNIRGVNSGFILRNLLIRGLVTREVNEKDQRSYIYKSTVELLSYLGIKSIDELPEYKKLRQTLKENLNETADTEAQK